MMGFVTHLLAFSGGSIFGICMVCILQVGKRADEEMMR